MWTKLQLEGPQNGESARIQQELESIVEGSNKAPVEIAADFLRQLKEHLVANLDQKYGKELWRTLPITLVITVPAVWSDAAKDRTFQAFQKAGFNSRDIPLLRKQILTTEPEAAAIHTIKTMRGTAQDKQLAVGDGFLVCDMGGGTVDLISYKVASLQPTTIAEATVGSGAQCGGTFIDREFLRWLEHRLGTTDFIKIAGCRSEDVPRTSLAKKAAQMLQDFTLEAKTCFSGDEPYCLRLPAPLSAIEEDETRGILDGELQLTP
jgi:molecular chaperone DnaK (HSP70)